MASVVLFPRRRRPTRPERPKPLGDKLQEIARLSPADLRDIEALADIVLYRLKRRQAG